MLRSYIGSFDCDSLLVRKFSVEIWNVTELCADYCFSGKIVFERFVRWCTCVFILGATAKPQHELDLPWIGGCTSLRKGAAFDIVSSLKHIFMYSKISSLVLLSFQNLTTSCCCSPICLLHIAPWWILVGTFWTELRSIFLAGRYERSSSTQSYSVVFC